MHKKVMLLAVVLQTTALFSVDTNLVGRVKSVLLGQISTDVFPADYVDPTFADWYGDLMAELGCSTNEVLATLAYVGTNCCADANSHTNSTESGIMGAAIGHLGRFDVAHEHVGALYYSVTNNAGQDTFTESIALVGALGLGHGAFAEYSRLLRSLPTSPACDLASAIASNLRQTTLPSSVTNRMVAFFSDPVAKGKISLAHVDMTLCELWQGYSTSSNRLINLNEGLGQSMPDFILSYLNEEKNELLALPPGTMQMLPTNQFYNVED